MKFIVRKHSSHSYTVYLRKPYSLVSYTFLRNGVHFVFIEKSLFARLNLHKASFPFVIRKWIVK